jgi:hypothetical protein
MYVIISNKELMKCTFTKTYRGDYTKILLRTKHENKITLYVVIPDLTLLGMRQIIYVENRQWKET